MARGPKLWTEELIERRKIEGYGAGEGATYKPWIGVTDFSSLGRVHRVPSPKVGRSVHLFSDVESNVFHLLEWTDDIIDIREQFPLQRQLTIEIAAALEIHHPCYPKTHIPSVMTVDFMVTRLRDGITYSEAFDCKRTEDAEDPRVIEKLEIVRTYFSGMDVPYRLVFHSKIPMQKVKNVEWIRGGILRKEEIEQYTGFYDEHTKIMASELQGSTRNKPLYEYCNAYDTRCGIVQGTGLRIAKMLMYQRILIPDLGNPDLASAPLASFQIAASRLAA